ncbi:hypothetical protein FNV43_RR01396 [Rhamnella rubrinervis]|uniref:Uncharacterized protein n=1 Tax=Rhamnella rubrinervis TaxID=2594499 RepID=A0A8K0MS87_9ROSA|nr:hypothetical protein FNV43_RR01396 [Rhamnella rubrinervis]
MKSAAARDHVHGWYSSHTRPIQRPRTILPAISGYEEPRSGYEVTTCDLVALGGGMRSHRRWKKKSPRDPGLAWKYRANRARRSIGGLARKTDRGEELS